MPHSEALKLHTSGYKRVVETSSPKICTRLDLQSLCKQFAPDGDC